MSKTRTFVTVVHVTNNCFQRSCSLQTYFNSNSLTLIRTLITGGTNADLEEILSEGGELPPGVQIGHNRLMELLRDRCTVAQLSIGVGVFQQFRVSSQDSGFCAIRF